MQKIVHCPLLKVITINYKPQKGDLLPLQEAGGEAWGKLWYWLEE